MVGEDERSCVIFMRVAAYRALFSVGPLTLGRLSSFRISTCVAGMQPGVDLGKAVKPLHGEPPNEATAHRPYLL